MRSIPVLLLDEHQLLRDAWLQYFKKDKRFTVCGGSGSMQEACCMIEEKRPAVILCDINMLTVPGMIRKFKVLSPFSRTIVLSTCNVPAFAKKCLAEGAVGFVTKNSSIQELTEAIIAVNQGYRYICKEVQETADVFPGLTIRELEIIKAVKEGYTSRQIAEQLKISVKTVEVHRYNVLKKLNLKNRAELVDYVNSKGR